MPEERFKWDGNAAGNYYIFRPDGSALMEVLGSDDEAAEIAAILNKHGQNLCIDFERKPGEWNPRGR